MTERELFSCITKYCEAIYHEIQRLSDKRAPYKQYLSSLCDQAMQAYFWEDQQKLKTLLRETRMLATRLQTTIGSLNATSLVA